MVDLITRFRHAVRSLLAEDIKPQALIIMDVKAAPEDPDINSHLKIIGFDRAMQRKAAGFGTPDEPEVGAWEITGLPERSATGFTEPTAWMLFMDWLWDYLKKKGLDPEPYTGFGDIGKPYGKLSVHQKRVRKYGEGLRGTPGEKGKAGIKWEAGYDIRREVTMLINSLGTIQDDVVEKFRELMLEAPVPNWFRLVEYPQHDGMWNVVFNIESEPIGHEERLAQVEAYKRENREKWLKSISTLAAGRTDQRYLAQIVIVYLIEKHGFQRPFHVDTLPSDDLERALRIIEQTDLETIMRFAIDTGKVPPTVAKEKPVGIHKVHLINRWNQITNKLASEGGVDPYAVNVALSDYMIKNMGFSAPLDLEKLSMHDAFKAVRRAGILTFDDIRGLIESIQRYIMTLNEMRVVNK